MIPKEFYKERMPLYTEDFDTEIYSAVQQPNSYRIDIRYNEKFNNYVYFFKIFLQFIHNISLTNQIDNTNNNVK